MPTMLKRLRETINAFKARDPAARSSLEIILLYPGFHAIVYHRIAHWLYNKKLRFLARCVSQWSRLWTGIEIHPGAKIGRRLVIDHGMGIVIGETTEIGDDVLLYQGVTLGGTGKDKGKRHPTIGNNVMVGAGAKVLGPFKVGDNARIAANAVVLKEVPPDSTAVGVPARIVRIADKRVNFVESIDHVSVTDPIAVELSAITAQMQMLERQIVCHDPTIYARLDGQEGAPAAAKGEDEKGAFKTEQD
ncbi:MAG TPA: serine O-acetyltransferase [Papillibacter sp.]|nr:serine O-acetyltransferase [Papillibacter sp.]